MTTVQDICDIVRAWAPEQLQEQWDNCGLCIGHSEREVNKVLLALDVTEEVADEAIATGCDMIVSHHPLIFKGIKHLRGETALERTVEKIVKNDIALYSAHTSADKVPYGVSAAMAGKLSLQDCSILSAQSGAPGCGLGMVGNLPKPLPLSIFLENVKTTFNAGCIRCSKAPEDTLISRVALCGGSGWSLIEDALASGAQIYLAADFTYHNFFYTANRMILADIGHYESEVPVLSLIKDAIVEKIPTFAVCITRIITNPILYL